MNAPTFPTTTETVFTPTTTALCHQLTGKHPADLLGLVDELGDGMNELRHLLRAIEAAAHDTQRPELALQTIAALASLGSRVSVDLANYADVEHDVMRTALADFNPMEATP